MRPVHLRVMELERNGERRFQKSAVISAPDDEGVIEYSAVHPDRAVKLRVDNGRGADHHALRQVVVLAVLGDLLCEAQIIGIEAREVFAVRNVAGADLAEPVFHDSVHRERVIAQQLFPDGQQVKLLYPAHRLRHPVIARIGQRREHHRRRV